MRGPYEVAEVLSRIDVLSVFFNRLTFFVVKKFTVQL